MGELSESRGVRGRALVGAALGRCVDAWFAFASLCFAIGLADFVYLVWLSPRDFFRAIQASLIGGWTLHAALLPLGLLAMVLFVAAGPRSGRHRDYELDIATCAKILTLCIGFVAIVGATGVAAHFSPTFFVKAHFASLATALASAGAIAASLFVFGFVHRIAMRALRLLFSFLPFMKAMLLDIRRLFAFLVSPIALLAIVVIISQWKDTFSYVPWNVVLRVCFAVVGTWGLYQLILSIRSSRGRTILLSATVLLSAGVAPFAINLPVEHWLLKKASFEDSLGGAVGRRAFRKAFDTDKDGMLSILGDGDCGTNNPRVYYGASDIPNNGVDEDCDGSDLSASSFTLYRDWTPSTAPKPRPDIVLITIDALAANRVFAARSGRSIAPNMAAFGRKSAVFDSAFAQGPSTRLSIPAMFTSKWDSLLKRDKGNGAPPYSLATSEKQFQDTLKSNGYDTAAVIPDINFVPETWRSVTRGFSKVDRTAVGKNHNAPTITKQALQILNTPRKKPLFLWVHYYDPHSPYSRPKGIPSFGEEKSDIYDAEIAFTDKEIKPLLDALRKRPNTYGALTSDHGTVFHPNPKTRKGHYGYDIYSSTLHVPLFFFGPKISHRVVSAPVTTLDIVPTLANLAGLNATPKYCGRNLRNTLLDGTKMPNEPVFHQHYLAERVLRGGKKDGLVRASLHTDTYNLVFNKLEGSYELYEWRKDYFEENNVVREVKHAAAYNSLRQVLGTFVYASTQGNQKKAKTKVTVKKKEKKK